MDGQISKLEVETKTLAANLVLFLLTLCCFFISKNEYVYVNIWYVVRLSLGTKTLVTIVLLVIIISPEPSTKMGTE